MDKVLNMTYASSLTDLCEVNSSFDKGILRICYTGKNRNSSFISKEAIEKSLPTIYNCPLVCNYDRETDTLGGHDIEIVCDSNGDLKIVNSTTPVGVIPSCAKIWFEVAEDENGVSHEYLYSEALIWKRQEAYQKIKSDGVCAQSMEITIKEGKTIDGILYIDDFEFTAFALIGVTPCFEGASLEIFSKQDFKRQFTEMMQELKESLKTIDTSDEVDDINQNNYSTEGGKGVLEDKMSLVEKYGINIDSLDFSIEDFTIEELTEKFEAMKASATEEQTEGIEADKPEQDNFALNSNIVGELCRTLEEVKIEREWGVGCRYYYVDCDFEVCEVYCWDVNDWLLYGFPYTNNGDSVIIDFKNKKRKKYVIADFDEGEQPSPFAQVFELMEQKLHDSAEWEAKYQTASDTIASMEEELGELRQFKTDTETAIAQSERDEVFAQFDDLIGVEAFEALREDCMKYDAETLEEKCYAIRGRNGTVAKFSIENKAPKLKVDQTKESTEPYGGIFIKYGITQNNE